MKRKLFMLVAVVLLLASTPRTNALENTVVVSPSSLDFTGQPSQSIVRTAVVSGLADNTVPISFLTHDLVDSSSQLAIPATSLKVQLLDAAAGVLDRSLSVTITTAGDTGTFQGTLDVKVGEQTKPIALTVHVGEAPNAQVDPNARSVQLTAQTNYPISFAPTTDAEVDIPLVQTSAGGATITDIRLLSFRDAVGHVFTVADPVVDNRTFSPDNTVIRVPVRISGRDLYPGSYVGTLSVRIDKQAALLQSTINLSVKADPVLPIVILLLSLIGAFGIGWYSRQGSLLEKLTQDLDGLVGRFNSGQLLLFGDERLKLRSELSGVAAMIESRAEAARIQMQLTAAQAEMDTAQTNNTKRLDDKTKELSDKVASFVSEFAAISSAFWDQLEQLRTRFLAGEFGDVVGFNHAVAGLVYRDGTLQEWLDLQETIKKLKTEDHRREATNAVRSGDTYPNVRETVSNLKASEPAGKDFVGDLPAGTWRLAPARSLTHSESGPLTVNVSSRTRLKTIGWVVNLLVYLLGLVIGFVLLYGMVPTFGANASDYIPLALWGFSVQNIIDQGLTVAGFQTLLAK